MCPAVFSTVHNLQSGHRGFPCHALACELQSSYLQLPVLLIFVDHCLAQITALVTIFAVCLLYLIIAPRLLIALCCCRWKGWRWFTFWNIKRKFSKFLHPSLNQNQKCTMDYSSSKKMIDASVLNFKAMFLVQVKVRQISV